MNGSKQIPQGDNSPRIATLEREKTSKPRMFAVIMLNDDFTPMEFVTFLLMKLFDKSQEEAVQIMFKIHNEGQAIIGIYAHSIAETLVDQAMEISKINEYPLRTFYEPYTEDDND